MKINELFDHDAMSEVSDMLASKCIDGARLTRAELCQELGLTEALPVSATKEQKLHNLVVEAIVGSIINLGVVEGFSAKKGPGGGIGVTGAEVSHSGDKKVKKAHKHVEYPAGFLENLLKTLDTLCVGDKRAFRKDIIKNMTLPEGLDIVDAMTLLSNAKSAGDLPGFDSKRGVGGGFFRTPTEVKPALAPVEPSAEALASEPSTEVVETSGEPDLAVLVPEEVHEQIVAESFVTEEVRMEESPEFAVHEEETPKTNTRKRSNRK